MSRGRASHCRTSNEEGGKGHRGGGGGSYYMVWRAEMEVGVVLQHEILWEFPWEYHKQSYPTDISRVLQRPSELRSMMEPVQFIKWPVYYHLTSYNRPTGGCLSKWICPTCSPIRRVNSVAGQSSYVIAFQSACAVFHQAYWNITFTTEKKLHIWLWSWHCVLAESKIAFTVCF